MSQPGQTLPGSYCCSGDGIIDDPLNHHWRAMPPLLQLIADLFALARCAAAPAAGGGPGGGGLVGTFPAGLARLVVALAVAPSGTVPPFIGLQVRASEASGPRPQVPSVQLPPCVHAVEIRL